MPTNDEIAVRFGYGRGHDFRDYDVSDMATWCQTCLREGVELEANCPHYDETKQGAPMPTDEEFKVILEEEWKKLRPPVPMGERRLTLAIRCMRRAYDLGRLAEAQYSEH